MGDKMRIRLVALVLCLSCLLAPSFNYPVNASSVYHCGGNGKRQVALTFDDGPHPDYTPAILSILEEYKVPATFFVIGENARQYPELVKKEYNMGNEIGNHTFSHPAVSKTSYNDLINETELVDGEILALTGKAPKIFRPPGGVCDKNVGKVAKEKNYSVILWTVDTKDWQIPPTHDIVSCVKTNLRPGAIILFHDYVWGASNTPEALRILIPHILDEGYEIVTVSELLGI
ncbi:MAG: polysaccharide deacetylase family protein [Ruminococcaceae bacterium]|nr:polysaccharide deacetylase family protein [Oscillospiraceae bacterium]